MKNPSSRESIPFTFTPPSPYVVPPGNYRAVLKTVSTDEDEFEEGKLLLRLVFDVNEGEAGPVKYSACLEYPEGKDGRAKLNRDLVNFYEPWEIEQMQGMPAEVDLTDFIGDEVDLTVATFTSSDEPDFSTITGIHRAGTLITGNMMALSKERAAAQHQATGMNPVVAEGSSLTVIPTAASGRKRG